MTIKNSKLTYPDGQEILTSVLELTQAQAAALWLVQTDQTASLVAEKMITKAAKSVFRRQINQEYLACLPQKPTLLDSLDELEGFLRKLASIHNAIYLPLRRSNRLIGLVILLNSTAKINPQVLAYIAEQITRQWTVSQQLQQQQRQLEEMTDQSRQWQAIYTGVQESLVLLNLKGKILTLNPATEHITGRTAQEMIGRHVGELFPKVGPLGSGINYPGPSGLYQTLAEKRPSDLFEAIVETKDKRHIWVNYTYTPLWDGNGQMMGLVRVTSDVSTIKNVEQMKNDFVSIASHELRTPLGVISGYLNLFLAGQLGPLSPDQQTFLERIYHSSADMSALVEDLLNISRIEAGKLEVSVQSFSLNQLIIEVLNHLELRSQSKAIRIHLKQDTQSILVRADRQKIEQALTNIIDNAIKYTYDRGTISISLKLKEGIAEVIIKDSGVGIRPEHIGHIFEKFYRENNPLSVKEGGSGLGLYISRKLIELHGGTITAASKPEHGSLFTIKLPITAKKYTM